MSLNIDTPSTPNTSLANPDGGPDLPRLPIPDCDLDEPPKLAVWLNSRLLRVSVSTLSGPNKRCLICERPMCDYQHLRKKLLSKVPPGKRPAPPPPESFKGPLPTNLPGQSKSTPARGASDTHRQSPADADPEHTCDPFYRSKCELPIKILTAGCEHYVGHACLERWIIEGRRQCPLCRTVWFKKANNRRQTLRESYSWWTQQSMLGENDVEVAKTYQGTLDRIAGRKGLQNAGDGKEGDGVAGVEPEA